jgi:chromosome segregation ATPase
LHSAQGKSCIGKLNELAKRAAKLHERYQHLQTVLRELDDLVSKKDRENNEDLKSALQKWKDNFSQSYKEESEGEEHQEEFEEDWNLLLSNLNNLEWSDDKGSVFFLYSKRYLTAALSSCRMRFVLL